VRRSIPVLVAALVLPLAGCKPAGRALASLQYHNLKLRLAPSIMSMSVGDGSVDMKPLMKRETYAGKVTIGRVAVEYPEGWEAAARQLASEFDRFYALVKETLGIDWSFDLVLRLVRVDPAARGFRYSVRLPRNRRLVFPIPVAGDRPDVSWTPVLAHEMTESSMIAPKKRSGLVLADLYAGSFCLPTRTRWFRDGVSDCAERLFEARLAGAASQPPGDVYVQLNEVRERLLDWCNCKGQPWWYNAASGLIFEMVNRYGADAVVRMMRELSKERVPDGGGLKRAFKRATGTDLSDFLRTYETPWAGFVASDTQRDPRLPHAVRPGSRVVVGMVYPATPASRRGIQPGDVILSFAGQPITSADGLAQVLARQKPWQMAPIELERNGERLRMRLKLIPRPVDIGEFLRLSGFAEYPLR